MPRIDRDPDSTLYISNIPIGTNADALKELFSKVGDVKDVYLPRDHLTHEQRGFAYVEFVNKDDADKSLLDLQGAIFMDVELNLALAKGRRKNAEQMQARNRFGPRGHGERPRGNFRRSDDFRREDREFRDRPIRESQQERHFSRKRQYEEFGEPIPRNMDYPTMPTQGRYEAPYGDRTYGGRPDPRYRDMPAQSYANRGRDYGGRFDNAYESYQPRQGDLRGRFEPSNGERYGEYRNDGYGTAVTGYGERNRTDARRGDRFEKPEFRHERPSARGGHIGRDFRRNEGHNMEMNGRPRHSFEPMQQEMPRGQGHPRQDAAMYYRKDRRQRSSSPPAKRSRFNNRDDIM